MRYRIISLQIITFFLLYGCSTTHQNNLAPSNTSSLDAAAASSLESNEPFLAESGDALLEADEEDPVLSEITEEDNSVKASCNQIIDDALVLCQKAQAHWQKKETREAIKALDEAYLLILNFETEDESAFRQQKEDLRFLITKRIYEIYASRNTIVSGPHKAIPIEMNEHVRAEINHMTSGRFMTESYRRSGRYRDFIVEELEKAGLPAELSWLPLIESGYKVNALSPARALGLWQFIPSTGYKFGLTRDRYVDERLDPEKSTRAAIAYLKELHQIFGDWSTVLAAYNCGEGRVLQVIRSQNVNYLDNFWDLYEKLPRETARYVPRFLATLHIINNPRKYGIDKLTPHSPYEYDTIEVSKQVRLKDIAEKLNTSKNNLEKLNPELRQGVLPPKKYSLNIPAGKSEQLLAALDTIPVASPPKSSPVRYASKTKYIYYKVRRGDTLSKIAKRHKTSVKKIRRANKLSKRSRIYAGKKLKIPVRRAVRSSKSYKTAKSSRASWKKSSKYVVKKGDSLWIIAHKYGISTSSLKRANKKAGKKLKIGQTLIIPGKSSRSSKRASTSLKTYRVRSGDAPGTIAKKHNMSLKRFLQVNNITSKSRIYPGQKLYVE